MKTAFVGAKKGEVLIAISPTEVMMGVDLSIPGIGPFTIKCTPADHDETTDVMFAGMLDGITCLMRSYFQTQGMEQGLLDQLGANLTHAVGDLASPNNQPRFSDGGSGVLEAVRDIENECLFEAEFDIPQGFLGEAHAKVVTADVSTIRRTPAKFLTQTKTGPQTRIVERPQPSLRNVVQKYRLQQNKPITGPLYVLVYNSMGQPVGVRSIKGPGWAGIGGGGKVATKDVVEVPGRKGNLHDVTVYGNPSRSELKALHYEDDPARAFVFPDSNQMVAWNAWDEVHANIAVHYLPLLGLTEYEAIPVMLYPGGYVEVTDSSKRTKWFHRAGAAKALQNCGALRTALGGPIREVSYFDEVTVGNWAALPERDAASPTKPSPAPSHSI